MRSKARFKFNSGQGAMMCSQCNTIIKTGRDFNEDEWRALRGEKHMPPQYCEECKNKYYSISFSGNL
jgi:hypothetical protein